MYVITSTLGVVAMLTPVGAERVRLGFLARGGFTAAA
jgi:hypothetical protein